MIHVSHVLNVSLWKMSAARKGALAPCNARPDGCTVEHITYKCGPKTSLVNLHNFICMWLHMLNKTRENEHSNDLSKYLIDI